MENLNSIEITVEGNGNLINFQNQFGKDLEDSTNGKYTISGNDQLLHLKNKCPRALKIRVSGENNKIIFLKEAKSKGDCGTNSNIVINMNHQLNQQKQQNQQKQLIKLQKRLLPRHVFCSLFLYSI